MRSQHSLKYEPSWLKFEPPRPQCQPLQRQSDPLHSQYDLTWFILVDKKGFQSLTLPIPGTKLLMDKYI
jgi:hypothetical protein